MSVRFSKLGVAGTAFVIWLLSLIVFLLTIFITSRTGREVFTSFETAIFAWSIIIGVLSFFWFS